MLTEINRVILIRIKLIEIYSQSHLLILVLDHGFQTRLQYGHHILLPLVGVPVQEKKIKYFFLFWKKITLTMNLFVVNVIFLLNATKSVS